jgi:hypothetical protein
MILFDTGHRTAKLFGSSHFCRQIADQSRNDTVSRSICRPPGGQATEKEQTVAGR